uniref:Uncharacterized protein n=1 Tax=Lotus japonicus TaxID=34305 RepID=I3S6F6_LOTJA|nr:unknown [Lotus japonicus]
MKFVHSSLTTQNHHDNSQEMPELKMLEQTHNLDQHLPCYQYQ